MVNIYKELATDIEGFNIPDHGNLTGWAKQGEPRPNNWCPVYYVIKSTGRERESIYMQYYVQYFVVSVTQLFTAGVLLLNACLTVRAQCANSHKDKVGLRCTKP